MNLYHSWGVEFLPCSHPECDFDRDKAVEETDQLIERMKQEIYARGVEV